MTNELELYTVKEILRPFGEKPIQAAMGAVGEVNRLRKLGEKDSWGDEDRDRPEYRQGPRNDKNCTCGLRNFFKSLG